MAATETSSDLEPISELDSAISRRLDVPSGGVWMSWGDARHLRKWWAAKPLNAPESKIGIRRGGVIRGVMQTPNEPLYPGIGIFLGIVRHERIICSGALAPGDRQAKVSFIPAIITLEKPANKARDTSRALQEPRGGCEKLEKMGFHIS